MKSLLTIFLFIAAATAGAQTTTATQTAAWTPAQLDAASTAKNIAYIDTASRSAIMYVNLARLYPKQFAALEVKNYYGNKNYGNYVKDSPYRQSLIKYLNTMEPLPALKFDKELYGDAKCFAAEMGNAGRVSHERKTCPKSNYAECISYGMDTGRDIALQWLIDHNVQSLGHRENCLNKTYSKIAICTHYHAKWGTCSVAEIIW